MMRFDSSRAISAGMFDEELAAICIEDGDGDGQNKGDEPCDRLEFLSQAV